MDEQVRKVKTRKQSAVNELPGETTVVPRHSHADIRNHQNDDEDIGPVLRWKTADEKPATENVVQHSQATRHYLTIWNQLYLREDVLYRKHISKDGQTFEQLITPPAFKGEILKTCHDDLEDKT
ncbi:hypothetical protein FSP39_018118 [Pinctada imbricata]|uniref:Uncharacterized protein n=1 Tax=Pinctada imbricata TaxID=66713 RepID=A0AA88Y9F1_PINIB|nr:hypothetical protein FSP39_018118 [Pinctada imbricata]